jgi:hypothetical protein
MSEFSALMAEEYQRRVASAQFDSQRATATVRSSIRRRRAARAVASSALAVVLVGVLTVSSYGVYARYQVDPAVEVTQSPTPQPTATSSPEITPTPHVPVSPSPSEQPKMTIAEYPPVAVSRGVGFPDAYQMRDWVWDYVAEGWSLQSYSVSQPPYSDVRVEILPAVIYLVSPEGAAFELLTLAPEYSDSLVVWSWQEGEHGAHIKWDQQDSDDGGSLYGELDLDTGDVSRVVFSTPWGSTDKVWLLAASANGNELWRAHLGDHLRYYRFGATDGWTVSSLNDLDGIANASAPTWDLVNLNIVHGMVTADGSQVLLENRAGLPDSLDPLTRILIYDVDSDVYFLSADNLSIAAPGTECTVAQWSGGASVTYRCHPPQGEVKVQVLVPGAPEPGSHTQSDAPSNTTVENVGALSGTISNSRGVLQSGYVGYGQAPVRDLYPYCGC